MKKIDNICIIDDDKIYRYIVKKEIEISGVAENIFFFEDGEQAIQFFENLIANNDVVNIPGLILVDINMPVMDGWEFIEKYVALKPFLNKKIVLFLVSSSVNAADVDRAKSISAISDYVVKPVSRKNILHMVETYLSQN